MKPKKHARAARNTELNALLRDSLHLTTAGGGRLRVSTRRRGECVSFSAGLDRPTGPVLLQASSGQSGWNVMLNSTGHEGDALAILRALLEEAARA